MGFFKKFLSKENHELSEEDKVKLSTILKGDDKEKEVEEEVPSSPITKVVESGNLELESIVEKLNFSEIKQLRLLLDKKEGTLSTHYENSEEDNSPEEYISVEKSNNQVEEIEIEEPITDDDLDKEKIEDVEDTHDISNEEPFEIQEIDDVNKIEEEFSTTKDDVEEPKVDENLNEIEIETTSKENNEVIIEETSTKEEEKESQSDVEDDVFEIKEDHPIHEKYILDKIKDIFGRENVFEKIDTKSKHEIINGKNIQYIGIRKLDAFEKNETTLDQNAWFIRNIKKLVELKKFKMVESNPSLKELMLENENNPVLLCYKATQLLKSPEEFNFD
ncbi:MAG: hypothetical protein PF569_03650 [Candidatus Woesearchaeota archaeon]|jgi:hypothetical protein|nr:hypothetical protein [Candidatus Woesearchaeota archaeon]